MQILKLDEHQTREIVTSMLQQRNLVPILGAGFSKGQKSKNAEVPDSNKFREVMLTALRHHVGKDANDLNNGFDVIAEHFLNPNFVPTNEVKKIIENYFTGVILTESRRNFLSCPWPYIYTLNIDDAIELNSMFTNKVLPNRKISEVSKDLNCVFKIHGDAAEELIYDEPSKIIFSTGQYVKSLTKNLSMLNFLKTDLVEQNTIFVGCSLRKEIDLLYALAEYEGSFPPGRRSIYVSTLKPNIFEMANLASHGVNSILLTPNYEQFYDRFASWGSQAKRNFPSLISLYRPKRFSVNDKESHQKNLRFLLRARSSSEADIPDFFIHRDLEGQVFKIIESHPLLLVWGRRYSGKTLLLKGIAESAKARKVYFFASQSNVSNEIIDEIADVKNGLFLFDSNALSPVSIEYLMKKIELIKENASTIIVAANKTEPEIVGIMRRNLEEEAELEIPSRFSQKEVNELNKRLDQLGISKFNPKDTILNNTYNLLKLYQAVKSELEMECKLSEREAEILLVVGVLDKAYSSMATALEVRTPELFKFCEKLAPIIEISTTSRAESKESHSKYKVVVNAPTGVTIQIQNLIKEKGFNWLSDRIANLVERFIKVKSFRYLARTVYMFDTINYLLPQEADGQGYRPTVLSLYQNLQPLLNGSSDYWLQRAKAILRLESREEAVLLGIDYALKAHVDATRERTVDNAEFTVALLYGKLAKITQYKNISYVKHSIEWFSRAINNYQRNSHYVRSMLEGDGFRRNSFHQLCDFLEGEVTQRELLPLRNDINFLIDRRRQWKSGRM